MADTDSRLTYVLDENFGNMAHLLRQSRAVSHPQVMSLADLGIPNGTLDPELLHKVGGLTSPVLLTRDGSMLHPVIQRGAWREAQVTLFLLGNRWAQMPLRELTRRLLFLWPSIVERAEAGPPGAAWRVSHTIPSTPADTFRLVKGQHAGGA